MKTSFGAARRQRYSDKEFAVAADETAVIGGGLEEENRVLQFSGSYSSRCLAAAANDCHGCAVDGRGRRKPEKYVIRSNLYLGKLPLVALWLLPACPPARQDLRCRNCTIKTLEAAMGRRRNGRLAGAAADF